MEVTRPEITDVLCTKIELKDENVNKDKLCEDLRKEIKDTCKLKIDEFYFVEKGTIPEDCKTIVDARKWD